MINIIVYSNQNLDIEGKHYEICNKGDMVIFLKELLDKIKYSDEKICLESAEIKENLVNFTEIERW